LTISSLCREAGVGRDSYYRLRVPKTTSMSTDLRTSSPKDHQSPRTPGCSVVLRLPYLAVTGVFAVAAQRIHHRGTRHRFETGIASSTQELALYAQATSLLSTHGYPTSSSTPHRRDPSGSSPVDVE
jgi:hypothetical protein